MKPIYLAYFFLLTFYFNNSVDFFELNFLPFNLNFFHSLLLILLVHDLFVSYFSLIIDEDWILNFEENDNVNFPINIHINNSIHRYF